MSATSCGTCPHGPASAGRDLVETAGGRLAVADQIMAADKTRLKSQLSVLTKADMLAVEEAILVHLGMPK